MEAMAEFTKSKTNSLMRQEHANNLLRAEFLIWRNLL